MLRGIALSRIGKNPVEVPDGVEVLVSGQQVTVKGKLGELTRTLAPEVEITREANMIWVKPRDTELRARSMWGLGRTLIKNMVAGVSKGFSRKLEIVGVGYRAAVEGNVLTLQLGYSHDIQVMIPDDIKVTCERPTSIEIAGANKQKVGQLAADIRGLRKPEPYKGKGIKYEGEYIFRKEGKKK
ncbi:MAG: 50S ribosomal protein L6 [Alphaproteobacteria bacterium MarineAlpha9_Bin7]|nr:MAG: 50S ribosomal protein L6 [Alphaproteobacteria bacterium MarineAlpha9_Bin7]